MKMKKLIFICCVSAVLASCAENGYVITGSVEGASEGDTVYLSSVENGGFVNLDSAVIKNGCFRFEGKQDETVNRYIRSKGKVGNTNRRLYTDFFLENGKIQVDIL